MAQRSPTPIPQNAMELFTSPTRAWEIIRVAQGEPEVLPLEQFQNSAREQEAGTVRFVAISDTHNTEAHKPIYVPPGDVLIHAGDFTQVGSLEQVKGFCDWFAKLPHPRKILVAGNHDLSCHRASYTSNCRRFRLRGFDTDAVADEVDRLLKSIPNCEYLLDSGTVVDGLSIWGSPWQPAFCGWAFNLPRGEGCREKWRMIPTSADVVVTHGPPLGHGDLCDSGQRAGCLDLLDELQRRVKPQFHVFGHIHEAYGVTSDGTTTYVNASTCDLGYCPSHSPLVFDLQAKQQQ